MNISEIIILNESNDKYFGYSIIDCIFDIINFTNILKLKTMKKYFILALSIVTIGFTSCNNQSEGTKGETDSLSIDEVEDLSNAEVTPEKFIDNLETAISNDDKDVSEQSVLANLKGAKIKIDEYLKAGNYEEAQSLATKVKDFIEKNKEALISVAPSAKEMIESIPSEFGETLKDIKTSLESKVLTESEGLKENVDNKIDEAKEAVKGEIESQKQAVEDAAKQKVEDAKNEAKQKASEAIDNATKDIKGKLGL